MPQAEWFPPHSPTCRDAGSHHYSRSRRAQLEAGREMLGRCPQGLQSYMCTSDPGKSDNLISALPSSLGSTQASKNMFPLWPDTHFNKQTLIKQTIFKKPDLLAQHSPQANYREPLSWASEQSLPRPGTKQERSLPQILGRKGWAHWGFEIKQTACLAHSYFFVDWSAGGIVEASWLATWASPLPSWCVVPVSVKVANLKLYLNPLRIIMICLTLGWAILSLLLLLIF